MGPVGHLHLFIEVTAFLCCLGTQITTKHHLFLYWLGMAFPACNADIMAGCLCRWLMLVSRLTEKRVLRFLQFLLFCTASRLFGCLSVSMCKRRGLLCISVMVCPCCTARRCSACSWRRWWTSSWCTRMTCRTGCSFCSPSCWRRWAPTCWVLYRPRSRRPLTSPG